MRVPDVHQFLPNLGYRDAVGNHTLETHRALRDHGFRSQIWAEDVHPEHARRAHRFAGYAKKRSAKAGHNLLLYQASTGSAAMVDALLRRPEQKLIYYHNITPASFFEPYDPGVATVMEKARDELRRLCTHVSIAMANSEYSARELRQLGVPDVTVVPPYLPPELTTDVDETHAGWLRSSKRGTDVLFVGRVVPNKGHLHLLRAFAALRASAPGSRLFVVGMWGPSAYMGAIQRLREKLSSEGIAFTGSITEASLAAHYREADVYVCLSEHEGFGLPLIEAMRAGVPVVAYDAGAVAETLGGSAVLIRTLDPRVIAEVVARVASDEDLRKELIRRQYDRVAELENVPRDEAIVECISAAAR